MRLCFAAAAALAVALSAASPTRSHAGLQSNYGRAAAEPAPRPPPRHISATIWIPACADAPEAATCYGVAVAGGASGGASSGACGSAHVCPATHSECGKVGSLPCVVYCVLLALVGPRRACRAQPVLIRVYSGWHL